MVDISISLATNVVTLETLMLYEEITKLEEKGHGVRLQLAVSDENVVVLNQKNSL